MRDEAVDCKMKSVCFISSSGNAERAEQKERSCRKIVQTIEICSNKHTLKGSSYIAPISMHS